VKRRILTAGLVLSALTLCPLGIQAQKRRPKPKRASAKAQPPAKGVAGKDDLFELETVTEEELRDSWLLVTLTSTEAIFAKPNRILRLPNQVVRAWFKVYDKDDAAKAVKPHKLELIEFNCGRGEMRLLSMTTYDAGGNAIDVLEPPSPEWMFVAPDSVGEVQMKKVCDPKWHGGKVAITP
jgi:hypothetical protein